MRNLYTQVFLAVVLAEVVWMTITGELLGLVLLFALTPPGAWWMWALSVVVGVAGVLLDGLLVVGLLALLRTFFPGDEPVKKDPGLAWPGTTMPDGRPSGAKPV